jgi:hypothetical protein
MIESFLPEVIFSRDFNRTLEKISQDIWADLLINKFNNQINDKLNSITEDFSLLLDEQQHQIKNELDNIHTAELYENMIPLSNMIENYTDLVNEQNNRFKFIVSNLPLEKFGYFAKIIWNLL